MLCDGSKLLLKANLVTLIVLDRGQKAEDFFLPNLKWGGAGSGPLCTPLDPPMSGLSILIHGVKSLPNATLCEKCFYELHSSTFFS